MPHINSHLQRNKEFPGPNREVEKGGEEQPPAATKLSFRFKLEWLRAQYLYRNSQAKSRLAYTKKSQSRPDKYIR